VPETGQGETLAIRALREVGRLRLVAAAALVQEAGFWLLAIGDWLLAKTNMKQHAVNGSAAAVVSLSKT
jgi:hypothetical protein